MIPASTGIFLGNIIVIGKDNGSGLSLKDDNPRLTILISKLSPPSFRRLFLLLQHLRYNSEDVFKIERI
jgi:hypothetical protein